MIGEYGKVAAFASSDLVLDFVLQTEATHAANGVVGRWSRERHRKAFKTPGVAHWTLRATEDKRPVGYAILNGVDDPDGVIHIKRMAFAEPGCGFGRDSLRLIKHTAFTDMQAHRLWLDVFEDNASARRLYASEGFMEEGTLRECVRREAGYDSLVVMSMLAHEYAPA
jgi:RimJ/RimL family protein N-acetyltransferase